MIVLCLLLFAWGLSLGLVAGMVLQLHWQDSTAGSSRPRRPFHLRALREPTQLIIHADSDAEAADVLTRGVE